MNILFQRLSVKLLLVFIAVIFLTTVSWHRSESTLSPEQLYDQENKALAELVALKMQIDSARSQIEFLDDLMQKNLRERTIKEQELAQILTDLSASSKKLGKWVEYSYRHGYVSILEVLVSSTDFSDFINRSVLLWTIVDQQARVCEENRLLRNQAEKSLSNINAINNEFTRNRSQLEKTVVRLKRSENELEQFLAELKKRSAELEARLATLSQQWAEVTGLTSDIIHRLSNLPAEEFAPDGIKFTLGGIRLEYSDTTINRAVEKVNPNPIARIKVNIKPELITISGSTGSRGVKFNAEGNFNITPDKKKIIFVPRSITVDGNTLEGSTLNTILNNSDLTWDITRYYPKLSITSLSSGDGIITFSLRY